MNTFPIVVFMPALGVYPDSIKARETQGEQTLHMIGFLADFAVDVHVRTNFEERKAELAPLGVTLRLYMMASRQDANNIGCGVYCGVEVADMAQAKTLPSFCPLGGWSGYHTTAGMREAA